MDTNKLRPDTRTLWDVLKEDPRLAGFVLIGGSALTLRIGHRVSEDLDFAYTGDVLPSRRLKFLLTDLQRRGIEVEPLANPSAEEEFIDSGLKLADYQQEYLLNGSVKVQFIRLDNEKTSCFKGDPHKPLRVASLDEIFDTKALVCAERSKTRDWFDLYVLLTQHGYTMADFRRAFEKANHLSTFDNACLRIEACKPYPEDEGYRHLLERAPSLAEMAAYFSAEIDKLQTDLARVAFRNQDNGKP